MAKVAVAGGSQGLGSAIVAGIEARGVDECFVLCRTARQDDARYLTVDYSNIEGLRDILERNEIHTVIAALSVDNGGGEAQLNLIEAAELSVSTKRFMPSEFGIVYDESHKTALPSVIWKMQAVERLKRTTSLEYTFFSNGQFLDYLTSPRLPTPLTFSAPVWIDLQNNSAVIPGDGTAPVVQTHTSDIGHYVAALLSLPRWEERYHLVGDRSSIAEQVRLAEEAKGVAFEKHFEKKETLLSGKRRMLPVHKEVLSGLEDFLMPPLAAVGVIVINGGMDLVDDGKAVDVKALFPELKTRTVCDALKYWVRGEANA